MSGIMDELGDFLLDESDEQILDNIQYWGSNFTATITTTKYSGRIL